MNSNKRYIRLMTWMSAMSVIFWVVFLIIFRLLWTGAYQPGGSLTLFWIWLAIGTPAFIGAAYFLFRYLDIPKEWYAAATLAFGAPASVLDIFATLFFEAWFPHGNVGDARIYPALILGGAGILYFWAVYMSAPDADGS